MLLRKLNETRLAIQQGIQSRYLGFNPNTFVTREITGGQSTVPTPNPPTPVAVQYLVTQNDNFLMTENNNNLII